MTAAARIAAAVLAVVFTWAALAKLVRREETADAFASLGLRHPAELVLAVPLLEMFVALELLLTPLVGAYGALFLLVAFTVVLVGVIRRDVAVGCACFGSMSTRPTQPVSWRSLARNGLLIALALVVAAGAPAGLNLR